MSAVRLRLCHQQDRRYRGRTIKERGEIGVEDRDHTGNVAGDQVCSLDPLIGRAGDRDSALCPPDRDHPSIREKIDIEECTPLESGGTR